MSINNIFVEPGVFSQFKPVRTFPVIPGGVRVAALIGAGRETNLITGEEVTKGALDATDTLAHTATVLGSTITDEDFNTYNLTTDYVLAGGGVGWTPNTPAAITGTIAQPYAGLVGTSIKFTVGNGTEQSYTFLIGDFVVPGAATAAEVVVAINANTTDVTCVVDTLKVKIVTDLGNNTSLLIGDGTSNLILGFTAGSYIITPKEPAVGKKYTVSYEYAKASGDYVPRFFFNMSDVVAEHGEVSTTDTLSLGAEIVFEQGASAVCLVQLNPADGSTVNKFIQALNKLANVSGINIIIPLTNVASLHTVVKAHVDTASSITERKERTAIVCMPDGTSIAVLSAQANGLDDKRMVLINIGSATRFVGSNTTVSTLDGSFVAAALAGIRTSRAFDVADPLTRKEIAGFDEIPDTLLRAEKLQLLSNGVLVVENIGGVPRVMQQVTTDVSTRENNEYSVVEIIDHTASTMRRVLENMFIGQKILSGTPSQVRATIAMILDSLVSAEIVNDFQNIQASINGTDPTQIDVSFEIRPVWPLNYILITFSLSPNQ